MKPKKEVYKRWIALIVSTIIFGVNIYAFLNALEAQDKVRLIFSLVAILGSLIFGIITLKQIRQDASESQN